MRRPPPLLAVVLLVAPAAGGCALVGDPCSAPVTGTAAYVSGSTPPPYHVEWTVRLEASSGTVTFSPGYGSSESWSATFVPDADRVGTACRTLRDENDADTPTGGGTLTVRWRSGSGRSTRLTSPSEAAVDAVRGAVPTEAWAQAEGAYERWQQAQRR